MLAGKRPREFVARLNELNDTLKREQGTSNTAKSDIARANEASNARREKDINSVQPYQPRVD
jgi:hypothetical protein